MCCSSSRCSINSKLKAQMYESMFCLFLTPSPSFSLSVFGFFYCVFFVFLRNMRHHNMTPGQFHPLFARLSDSHAKPQSTVLTYTHPVPNGTILHSRVCLRRIHPHTHKRSHWDKEEIYKRQLFIETLSHNILLSHTPRHTSTHMHTYTAVHVHTQPAFVLWPLQYDYIISEFRDWRAS